jgi:hypothetical protein
MNLAMVLGAPLGTLIAVHAQTDGLRHPILTRVDDTTWMDLWHWDSAESLKATRQAQLPAAKAAFAMVEVVDGTMGRIVA